ncbi:unnamed protein product [Alopecurus aequalis]
MAVTRCSSKHIVVAAGIGILVTTAITIVALISLTPPQLMFSILDASRDSEFYNFTLSATNTSPRMEVHYTSLNTEIWIDPGMWYLAEVNMSGYVQSPQNVSKVPGFAVYYGLDTTTESQQYSVVGNWPNCTVVVIAKVWFKVGLARTQPYLIRVSCFPVNFLNHTLTPYANCTS